MFLTNLAVQKKQFFGVELLAGLCSQVFNSKNMYKLKITIQMKKNFFALKQNFKTLNLLYH